MSGGGRRGLAGGRWLAALGLLLAVSGCSVLEPRSTTRAASSDKGAPDVTASPDGGSSCGKITATGCCDGETLWWCVASGLQHKSCAGAPKCGWSNSKIYDCDTTGTADPTGVSFMQCAALAGDAGLPTTDGPGADGGGCQGIKREGCCDGNTLKYCEDGKLKTLACKLNPRCGWLPNGQLYDCGTSGTADPAGKHAKACPGTKPVDLGPDQTPDGTGDAVVDLGGDVTVDKSGCTCSANHGPGPAFVLILFLVLLARTRRDGR